MKLKNLLYWLCSFFMVSSMLALASAQDLTILFTHDLHDHIEPYEVLVDDQVLETGGYERLYQEIQAQRQDHDHVLVLDAGDYSMGTLYQTIYTRANPSLQLLGQMGFDATTFGNHEFDYKKEGFLDSLLAAKKSGQKLPHLLAANVSWEDPEVAEVFEELDVKSYTLLEEGPWTIGIFGLIGEEAISNAPMAGIDFLDPIEAAKEVVAEIQTHAPDLIIALSHSGTSDQAKRSEDELLAQAVPEIDLIISGHSHTTLAEPLQVGQTTIASSGYYGQALGKVTYSQSDQVQVEDYEVIPLDQPIETEALENTIDKFRAQVQEEYLDHFDLEFDQVLAQAPFNFTSSLELGQVHREEPLGNLLADAFQAQVFKQGGDEEEPVVAVVPYGTIRDSLTQGPVTVSDVYNVNSLGVGPDGLSGYPLIKVYLTGADLRTVAEVDASLAPLQPIAQLYTAGLNFTFNPGRLPLNKVTDVYLTDSNQERVEIEDDTLYPVVAGLYTGQMLSLIEDESFGILQVTPRKSDGSVIEDLEDHLLLDDGQEIKEWQAVADYLQSFPSQEGLPQIPDSYAQPQGRKVIDESTRLYDRIKAPNRIAFIIYAIGLLVLLLLLALAIWLYRRLSSSKEK